jgi:hypothetical protein
MSGFFISYRREDGAGHAGRVFDRLTDRFGVDQVFMDVSDIEPGVDFVEAIEAAISSCDALLVVIGTQWLDCRDADGNRRLDDPNDPVRLEIAHALARNVRVIPLLIRGARMPAMADLPSDVGRFSSRQALELSDSRWEYDAGRLIEALEKIVNRAPLAASRHAAPVQRTSQPQAAPVPAFDADKIRKVDYRTWKWEDRVFVGADAAFQAADEVLKTLGFTVKDVDFPRRITAGKGMMSGWSALLITGGEEIVVELDAIDDQQTVISISSRPRQTNLVDPLATNRKNVESIVRAFLALLNR